MSKKGKNNALLNIPLSDRKEIKIKQAQVELACKKVKSLQTLMIKLGVTEKRLDKLDKANEKFEKLSRDYQLLLTDTYNAKWSGVFEEFEMDKELGIVYDDLKIDIAGGNNDLDQ